MSNADNVRLSYVKEVTYGTHPGGTLKDILHAGEGLEAITGSIQSRIIRSDRQVQNLIRNDFHAAGPIPFELSYGNYDDLLQYGLFSAGWSAVVDAMTASSNKAVTITGATGVVNDDSATGSFSGINVGQWIKLGNFSNAANNGLFKVKSKASSNNITVAGKTTMVNETKAASASANAIVQQGAQIVNGSTLSSISIERQYTDLSNEYAIFKGMIVGEMSMALAADGIMTGTFGMMGKSEVSVAASSGSGYTEANANQVMNAIDNVLYLVEGVPVVNTNNAYETMGWSMVIANGLRPRKVFGTLGPASYGLGKYRPTGTLTAYYATKAVLDKYLNFTASAQAVLLSDADGNKMVIEHPQVKYTMGRRVAGGEETDIVAETNWTAYRHATEDVTTRIARFAA